MKKLTIGSWLILSLSIITISACGDSGSKSGQHQFTNALVKLSTATTATSLGGAEATIVLPPGVMVSSSTPSHSTDIGVVVPSGQTSTPDAWAIGVYTAANTSPATVHVLLASTTAFGPGEFVSVRCIISAGSYPTQSDFSLSSSPSPTVFDINGVVISSPTATVSLSVSFL